MFPRSALGVFGVVGEKDEFWSDFGKMSPRGAIGFRANTAIRFCEEQYQLNSTHEVLCAEFVYEKFVVSGLSLREFMLKLV
jgi:hypothetical protein